MKYLFIIILVTFCYSAWSNEKIPFYARGNKIQFTLPSEYCIDSDLEPRKTRLRTLQKRIDESNSNHIVKLSFTLCSKLDKELKYRYPWGRIHVLKEKVTYRPLDSQKTLASMMIRDIKAKRIKKADMWIEKNLCDAEISFDADLDNIIWNDKVAFIWVLKDPIYKCKDEESTIINLDPESLNYIMALFRNERVIFIYYQDLYSKRNVSKALRVLLNIAKETK
jgi:hypothetical protein|tara:strand:+ start:2396 stop:3064 length:669 start_codon:yes stop_codon:yes gene_type:complete